MYRIFSIEATENEHSSLSQLRQRLESQGYEMVCHQANVEVLEEIKQSQPDLILMDPTLPDQHGFKVCETLKNDPSTESIPVIFIHTGQNANGTLLKSFESGANDFISLETEEVEVFARLQAAIRSKQAMAQSIALAEQLNKMNSELYERNLQVEKELYIARQLQQSLLPPFLPEEDETPGNTVSGKTVEPQALTRFSKCHYKDDKLRITGIYLPCDALGGDIYDVIKFPNGTIGVAIADVSGHGVPAGFITAIFKSSFYRITHTQSSPGDILFHLNNELADIVKTGEYVTAIYSRICFDENDQMTFEYSGAGHPYPVCYKASENKITRLQENGTPLVWVKNMEYPMGRIALEPGDRILFFTDGISEMRNTQGELYGEERLEQSYLSLIRDGKPHLLDEMIQHLSDFTEGHPLEDDLSAVLIEAL